LKPFGVVLAERSIVGKKDVIRQKAFREERGQNNHQQYNEENSGGRRFSRAGLAVFIK